MSAKKPSKEIVQQVLAEVGEHLTEIEAILLKFEGGSAGEEDLGELFRRMHTIKGISGVLDRPVVVEIAHRTESFLELLRERNETLSPEHLDILLRAKDLLGRALQGEIVDHNAFLRRLETQGVSSTESPISSVKKPSVDSAPSEENEEEADVFLLFRASERLCAIAVSEVREISQILPCRKIPFTPANLRGVASLRGQLVPVLHLAALLQFSQTEERRQQEKILFLDLGEELVGVLVDRVVGVAPLPGWDRSVPALRYFGVDAVEAVGAYEGEVVTVLSAERLVPLVKS